MNTLLTRLTPQLYMGISGASVPHNRVSLKRLHYDMLSRQGCD